MKLSEMKFFEMLPQKFYVYINFMYFIEFMMLHKFILYHVIFRLFLNHMIINQVIN